ncbi:hypothetical protein PAERUG_P47_London_12_VIM_2_12_12_02542 [Pseudomonas aeruginosa]|nr:hypothetical protein PAERUG_P47_London_12_VIM_2_12_12_02542 [Pseudomonas aeruginosa]
MCIRDRGSTVYIAGGDRAVVAGGEDVRKAGQVADLLHRRFAVGQFQQVEVGVGHQHVFGLAADPATHVDVAVGAAGTRRIDRQADAGVLFLAGTAVAAGDVERYRDQVADLHGFHATPDLHHLAGDLVAQHQAFRRGGTAAHHVLVGAADVGGDHPQDHPVVDLPALRVLHLRIGNVLHLDLARAEIDHTTIARHTRFLFVVVGTNARRPRPRGFALESRLLRDRAGECWQPAGCRCCSGREAVGSAPLPGPLPSARVGKRGRAYSTTVRLALRNTLRSMW